MAVGSCCTAVSFVSVAVASVCICDWIGSGAVVANDATDELKAARAPRSDRSAGEAWSTRFCTEVHHVSYSGFGVPLPWVDGFEVEVDEPLELHAVPKPSATTSATTTTPTFVFDAMSPTLLVAHAAAPV